MRSEKTSSHLPLLLAALALLTAVATAIAFWVWLPQTNSAQAGSDGASVSTPAPYTSPSTDAVTGPPGEAAAPGEAEPELSSSSDSEVLTTISMALEDYFAMSDAITSMGGVDAERITDFVTPEYLPVVLDEYARYAALGLRTTGPTSFDHLELDSIVRSSDGSALVSVAFCIDRSKQKTIEGPLTISGSATPFRDHFIVDFEMPAHEERPLLSYSVFSADSILCPTTPDAGN